MITFVSVDNNFPELLAQNIINGWFADMKKGKVKYIIFNDLILSYTIRNKEEKSRVLDVLRKRGIPEEQFNWKE